MAVGLETGEMKRSPDRRYRHRFPAGIISHAVWPYRLFSLSPRDVELLLAERGIVVSYETVRPWREKFGEVFEYVSVTAVRGPVTSGVRSRCSSGSRARSIMCGIVRLTSLQRTKTTKLT
jgi:putative transposase